MNHNLENHISMSISMTVSIIIILFVFMMIFKFKNIKYKKQQDTLDDKYSKGEISFDEYHKKSNKINKG